MSHSCDCPLVLGFLNEIGAKHSAKMHANPDHPWTDIDWLMHFAEEERYLFPLFPPAVVRTLLSQHQEFRRQISLGRPVSKRLLDKHGALEDAEMAKLIQSS